MVTEITDKIAYLMASETPLSSDVGIIEGKRSTYLFDLGNSEKSLKLLRTLHASGKDLKVILSHFHPDHIGNLKRIMCMDNLMNGIQGENSEDETIVSEIYVGANTYGYTHCGKIVSEEIYIDDGVKLHIFPLVSSHAKGCLGVEVNGEYAFLGDATYSTRKNGKIVYNATLLAEEIQMLEKLEANFFLLSHHKDFVQNKEDVLKQLKKIYNCRQKGQPYIVLYQ